MSKTKDNLVSFDGCVVENSVLLSDDLVRNEDKLAVGRNVTNDNIVEIVPDFYVA